MREQTKWHQAQRIIDAGLASTDNREARSRLDEIQLYPGYAEPGYGRLVDEHDEEIVAIGNWNTINRFDHDTNEFIAISDIPKRVGDLLEKVGIEIEWSDEWTSCDECQKLVRTQPDSYCWTRSYVDWPDGLTCEECTDEGEYLESLEGDHNKAVTLDVDFEDHGYRAIEEDGDGVIARFANGLYGGQCASPEKVAESLEEQDITRYVFHICDVGQFDMHFAVYIHEEAIEPEHMRRDHLGEYLNPLEDVDTDGVDPAEMMKSAIQDATSKMDALSGEGVKYAKCNSDGTADVRLVSPREFIEGIKDD
jgi:hypothetical protein